MKTDPLIECRWFLLFLYVRVPTKSALWKFPNHLWYATNIFVTATRLRWLYFRKLTPVIPLCAPKSDPDHFSLINNDAIFAKRTNWNLYKNKSGTDDMFILWSISRPCATWSPTKECWWYAAWACRALQRRAGRSHTHPSLTNPPKQPLQCEPDIWIELPVQQLDSERVEGLNMLLEIIPGKISISFHDIYNNRPPCIDVPRLRFI